MPAACRLRGGAAVLAGRREHAQPGCAAGIQHKKKNPPLDLDCICLRLLCAGSEAGLPSWLDGGSTRSLAALPAASCVAGEALSVSVGLANPLALALALSGVRLLYEHDGGGDGDAEVHLALKP